MKRKTKRMLYGFLALLVYPVYTGKLFIKHIQEI